MFETQITTLHRLSFSKEVCEKCRQRSLYKGQRHGSNEGDCEARGKREQVHGCAKLSMLAQGIELAVQGKGRGESAGGGWLVGCNASASGSHLGNAPEYACPYNSKGDSKEGGAGSRWCVGEYKAGECRDAKGGTDTSVCG